jgi:hypothetical protein
MSHSTTIKTVPISSQSALRAAVSELQNRGIEIELLENEKPRMYYANQIKKQIVGNEAAKTFDFNEDPDVCDFVLKVPGSYYDIGLLRNADGSGYTPVFDDYTGGPVSGAPTTAAMRGLKSILGNKYDGKVEHWAGQRDDVEGSLFSIGKVLASYTKHATIEAATMAGHSVAGCIEDPETGEIKLTLTCQ